MLSTRWLGIRCTGLRRSGESSATSRDLGIIHEEAERRLGFRMSDTQAAAFGFAELLRLWEGAALATSRDRSASRAKGFGPASTTDDTEAAANNNEHPFDA